MWSNIILVNFVKKENNADDDTVFMTFWTLRWVKYEQTESENTTNISEYLPPS